MRLHRCFRSGWPFLLLAALLASPAQADPLSGDKIKIQPVVPLRLKAFPLRDVGGMRQQTYWPRGSYWHPTACNLWYLNMMAAEPLLHNFRATAGMRAAAGHLAGWEDPRCELRGHFTGHYLSACAFMHGNLFAGEPLDGTAGAIVAGMAECQARLGSGYLSGFPERFFDRLEAGKPVWAPYSALHKILAGLLDMYVYCDNSQALEVARKLGDWVIARNARLTDDQLQKLLEVDHGGMSEALADLYGLTGEEKYLKIARRFNHAAVLDPASRREDKLTGLPVAAQVAKFIGAARQYELTGEARLRAAAEFFWETVTRERSYVTAGIGERGRFPPKEKLSESLSNANAEGCATYGMIKLTRHLYCWDPQVEYADYQERAVYNHAMAAQNRDRWNGDGKLCFYLPLRPGAEKKFGGYFDSLWCCTGAGLESNANYAESLYFHDGDKGLYVSQYAVSNLNWKEKGLTVALDTMYPEEEEMRFSIGCQKPTEMTLCLRRPAWATAGLTIKLNGKPHPVESQPGGYTVISRTWKGDSLEVKMPMAPRIERFRDNPQRIAILYGPAVLCAEVDPAKPCPVIVTDDEAKLLASLKPVVNKPLTFTVPGDLVRIPGEPPGRGLTLEPFYKLYFGRHYTVYFDICTPGEWPAKEAALRARVARP